MDSSSSRVEVREEVEDAAMEVAWGVMVLDMLAVRDMVLRGVEKGYL